MWNHGIEWEWLGTLGLGLFWLLIIVLALAPTKYLRAELCSPEMNDPAGEVPAADGAPGKRPAAE